jgi:hypothetical protein
MLAGNRWADGFDLSRCDNGEKNSVKPKARPGRTSESGSHGDSLTERTLSETKS